MGARIFRTSGCREFLKAFSSLARSRALWAHVLRTLSRCDASSLGDIFADPEALSGDVLPAWLGAPQQRHTQGTQTGRMVYPKRPRTSKMVLKANDALPGAGSLLLPGAGSLLLPGAESLLFPGLDHFYFPC